jgi:branched-chain amino acid transport system permease protein
MFRFLLKRFNYFLAGAILSLLCLLPIFMGSYYTHILILILLYAYLGSCWNILGGYGGQFSFGHAIFLGLGAYTSTILYVKFGISPWIGMLLGGFLSMIVGMCVGFICFRYGLKGPFFALATLAFAEMFRIGALNVPFTGKAAGILIAIKGTSFFAFQFSEKIFYFYIILVFNVFVVLVTHLIVKSKLGDYLEALREDEDAAEALGIDTLKYKMIAISISSFLTALGGTFYAQYLFYIDPDICFGVQNSIEIFIRPILGGLGTVYGPFLGSLILGPLSEVSRGMLRGYSGMHLMLFGAVLVIVVVFLPKGVMGFAERKIKHLGQKQWRC